MPVAARRVRAGAEYLRWWAVSRIAAAKPSPMVVWRPGDRCDSRSYPDARVLCSAWLAPLDHALVVIVGTNPHPQEILTVFDSQGPMSKPDPGRPQVADLLELERGVPRIRLQELEVLVSEFTDIVGQALIALPKPRCRPMPHSSLSFPSLLASSASLIRKSSLPALESSSICPSHCSQSLS